ncbi:MAG TPA: DMT family transporter [Steroidobacteraceae bacterium]|nr:DMT family transporter [Steroidobacteraceae bacterium]
MTVPQPRLQLYGVALVGAGALLFAAKGIFAKILYARGVTVEQLVTLRAVLALPFFWGWGWLVHKGRLLDLPLRPALGAAFAGALCYYAGALLDFHALTLIDASLERAVLFSYPALVVVAVAVRDRKAPSARTIAGTVLTYAGIVFAVTGLDAGILRQNAFGAALVLLCAGTFATYFLLSERYMGAIGSVRFTVVAMTTAAVMLVAHFLLTHSDRPLTLPRDSGGLMAGLVLFSTVMSAFLVGEGIRRIGASRAAVISTIGPPATILYAAVLLGERLTLLQLGGIAVIIAGILTVELRRR